jgi:hypothetical protein
MPSILSADPHLKTLDRIALDLAISHIGVFNIPAALADIATVIADTMLVALTLAAEGPEYAEAIRRERLGSIVTVSPIAAAGVLADQAHGLMASYPIQAVAAAPAEAAAP